MSTFPAIKGSQLIKALRRLGFDVIRIKGSHHFLQHPGTYFRKFNKTS